MDTDNDGCPDTCEGCSVEIQCEPGTEPVDTDGDGCADECFPTEKACYQNGDCGDGEYCKQSECVGDTTIALEGVCTPKPLFCPDNFSPVCTCSGVTYSNACEAAKAGENISYTGACL